MRVFISYSSRGPGLAVADRLHARLRDHGVEPWLYTVPAGGVPVGKPIGDYCARLSVQADLVLAVLCSLAISSRYVQAEVEAALDASTPLVSLTHLDVVRSAVQAPAWVTRARELKGYEFGEGVELGTVVELCLTELADAFGFTYRPEAPLQPRFPLLVRLRRHVACCSRLDSAAIVALDTEAREIEAAALTTGPRPDPGVRVDLAARVLAFSETVRRKCASPDAGPFGYAVVAASALDNDLLRANVKCLRAIAELDADVETRADALKLLADDEWRAGDGEAAVRGLVQALDILAPRHDPDLLFDLISIGFPDLDVVPERIWTSLRVGGPIEVTTLPRPADDAIVRACFALRERGATDFWAGLVDASQMNPAIHRSAIEFARRALVGGLVTVDADMVRWRTELAALLWMRDDYEAVLALVELADLEASPEDARSHLRAVLTHYPFFPPAWFTLAWVDLEVGDHAACRAAVRRGDVLTELVRPAMPVGAERDWADTRRRLQARLDAD